MRYTEFIRAADLKKMTIPAWEFHVHTSYTDGRASVSECVKAAIDKGIERLVFTEHTEPWQAHDSDWFMKYVEDINRERDRFNDAIELLIGIEAPAISFDGELEMTSEMEKYAEFILGAAHRYPDLGKRRVQDLNTEEALEMEFNTLMALCKNPQVDAIAHIGATCSKYCGPFPLKLTREVVKSATASGKAIEINHGYHKPLEDYLNICVEEDALIIPGSNAHDPDWIGNVYRALVDWQNDTGRRN